jgi:nicotinate-nucleotide adenylyltransferase
VGADSLLGLPGWHQWEDLFRLAHFIVADRPGSSLEQTLPAPLQRALESRWAESDKALFSAPAGRVLRLHAPLRSESATAVRERIAAKGDWRQLLPGPVADFVAELGLYGLRTGCIRSDRPPRIIGATFIELPCFELPSPAPDHQGPTAEPGPVQ